MIEPKLFDTFRVVWFPVGAVEARISGEVLDQSDVSIEQLEENYQTNKRSVLVTFSAK